MDHPTLVSDSPENPMNPVRKYRFLEPNEKSKWRILLQQHHQRRKFLGFPRTHQLHCSSKALYPGLNQLNSFKI